jgi:hypothetical protein
MRYIGSAGVRAGPGPLPLRITERMAAAIPENRACLHKHSSPLRAVLSAALPVLMAASATGQDAQSATVGLKIIVVQPAVRFEDVRSLLAVPVSDESEIDRLLIAEAKTAVGSKAIVLDADKLEPQANEECVRLHDLGSRLARGDLNEDASASLARLAALDPQYAVFVQFIRVKTGPGKSWNAWTGAITSSSASTLMQAAVLSGNGGRVLWKGERLIRNKALKPASPEFAKELALLYKGFELK